MMKMNRNLAILSAKLGLMVTIFVLTTACSHETVQPDTVVVAPIVDAELNDNSPIESPVQNEATFVKPTQVQSQHVTRVARHHSNRRVRSKMARLALKQKQHIEKVQTVALGSVKSDIPLPPAPAVTSVPSVIDGPQVPNSGWFEYVSTMWPYGAITILIFGSVFAISRGRRIRSKSRRIIFNS